MHTTVVLWPNNSMQIEGNSTNDGGLNSLVIELCKIIQYDL